MKASKLTHNKELPADYKQDQIACHCHPEQLKILFINIINTRSLEFGSTKNQFLPYKALSINYFILARNALKIPETLEFKSSNDLLSPAMHIHYLIQNLYQSEYHQQGIVTFTDLDLFWCSFHKSWQQ